tara:strand:+ start:552 stop:1415 length:864 start_codon:yes stop_codon:yes gene_type:complete
MSESEFIRVYRNIFPLIKRHLDMLMLRHWDKKINVSKNILNKSGRKFYSQSDEDGILMEILNRIKIKKGNFLEIGVCGLNSKNGTENNTIILLMMGWKGIWVDSVDLDIKLFDKSKLDFVKKFLKKENCYETLDYIVEKSKVDKKNFNVISVDIDGNDFYITEAILKKGFEPDCFIVEYNGKFPPPIIYNMPYKENYVWKGGDEQGSSIQFWVNFFEKFNYSLVCCNITGTNAFFINNKHMDKFTDIPKDINQIYYPPDYNWFTQIGHQASTETIEYFINKSPNSEE